MVRMDQALKDERLELMIKHTSHRERIANLRAEQKLWNDRITQIDRIELRESLNLDGEDTAISLDTKVALGG
jgi:hypothetical protein